MTRRAIILTWPDHLAAPELLAWLTVTARFRWDDIEFNREGGRDVCVAYNAAIKCGIESGADELWIIDRDTRPHPVATSPILTSALDVACCKSPREGAHAFAHPGDFHAGLFRLRRSVALAIGLPAFYWPTTADGATLTGCCCAPFADKARKLGFSVGWAGEAGHVPARNDGLVSRYHCGLYAPEFTTQPLVRTT